MSVIKHQSPNVEKTVPSPDLRFYDQELLKKNPILRLSKKWLSFKKKAHEFGMRRFSIMLVPHTGQGGYTFHISNYILFFMLGIGMISVISASLTLAQGHQTLRSQERLVVENDDLEAKIRTVSQTVENLSDYFAKFRVEVSSIVDNPLEVSSVALNELSISVDQESNTLKEIQLLRQLEKELDVTKEKIFSIGNYMQDNKRVLRELPSLYPVARRARVTSRFGIRRNPFDARGVENHSGLDLATLPGTPVYATADGVVSKVGMLGGYGNLIEIKHKYEFTTRYGHLQGFAAQIYPGARVKQGQVIGYVGATGRVTGYHLHYEMLIAGRRVDPEPFVMMLR